MLRVLRAVVDSVQFAVFSMAGFAVLFAMIAAIRTYPQFFWGIGVSILVFLLGSVLILRAFGVSRDLRVAVTEIASFFFLIELVTHLLAAFKGLISVKNNNRWR